MTEITVRTGFARAVKSQRDRLGLSQEKLAERANLHRTYISDVERGARNLSLESISRLARALDTSISALFAGPESRETATVGDISSKPCKELVDILLVEDNPDDVEMTLHAFKKAKFNNRILVVRDGTAALDYLFCKGAFAGSPRNERLRVILLDLNLPDINGLDVLRRIKADERTRKIPVVVLTASRMDNDFNECQRLGASTYIVKPVDFQRLSMVTPQLDLSWELVRTARTA